MTNKIDKPYYELYPSLNCSGIILVDDVPVFSFLGADTSEGIFDGTVPINHILLQSGKHEIIAKMFPRHEKKALTENDGINVKFNLCDFDNWKETKHSFFPELNTPDAYFDKNNKITSPMNGLSSFEVKTQIEVELPFILNGWQNSLDLRKIDKKVLKRQVFEFYNQIHAILTTHNAAKFLNLSKEKEDLQTQAFYFNGTKKQEIRQSIIDLFSRNLEVMPLDVNELKLEYWGYGKLVRLVRLDGSDALQFKKIEENKNKKIELEVKLHMRSLEKGLSII
jgi:hypothetical protein